MQFLGQQGILIWHNRIQCLHWMENRQFGFAMALRFLPLFFSFIAFVSSEIVLAYEFQLSPLSDRSLAVSVDSTEPLVIEGTPTFRVYITDAGETSEREVSDIGYSKQVNYFDDPWLGEPTLRQRWVLELSELITPGAAISVDIESSAASSECNVKSVYTGKEVNGSVQANQVGYLVDGPKFGFIGNWSGKSGIAINATEFELISVPSDSEVFSGTLELHGEDSIWSGNQLYRADFSEFSRPGRYQLHVSGVGRSQPFEIGQKIYEPIAIDAFKTFYHHRNSDDVVAPYAQPGYERPNGAIPGSLNGIIHPVIRSSVFYNKEKRNAFIPVRAGWFDAADYGQYITNAALVWYWFGLGLDLAPSLYERDDLNIPESSNGIPDLIDELSWGFKWALSMQDKQDGGVYSRIVSETWDDELPADIPDPRLIYEKTTHSTAAFAALAAIHARLVAPINKKESNQAIKAAELAWVFLQTHKVWPAEGEVYANPKGTHAGEYKDRSSRDTALWAAAELLRATGNLEYKNYIQKNYRNGVNWDPTGNPSFHKSEMAAAWAWVASGQSLTDDVGKFITGQMLLGSNWRVKQGKTTPYNAIVHHHAPWLGWGAFARSTRNTLNLLQSYTLTNNKEYIYWALRTPDAQLGVNPLGLSFITGHGQVYPMHPLSKLQQHSKNFEPIHGLAINGPHANLPGTLLAHRIINSHYVPTVETAGKGTYPVMRRYVDSNLVPPMNEPTVAEQAYTAISYLVLNEYAHGRLILD